MPPNNYVLPIRLTLLSLLTTAILCPSLYQRRLDSVYGTLKDNAIYRSSTFETFWTVLCYAVIEPWMTHLFMTRPGWRFAVQDARAQAGRSKGHQAPPATLPRPKGMRRPARRWREALVYMAPLLLLDATTIKKLGGVPLEAMLESGNYDARLAGPYHGTNFLAPSLHNFTLASPLQTARALPQGAPSSRRLALELLASFAIYDAVFFLFHLALHRVPWLARFHAEHHAHAEMQPQVTNRLHVGERLGLVLLANFSLNVIGGHVLTRTLFVPVFVWLLVELHSGLDVPWGYEKVLPPGWGGGARKHMVHHRVGRGGVAPYFEWWDGLVDRVAGWAGEGKRTPRELAVPAERE